MRTIIFLSALLILGAYSCTTTLDTDKDKEAIKAIIEDENCRVSQNQQEDLVQQNETIQYRSLRTIALLYHHLTTMKHCVFIPKYDEEP